MPISAFRASILHCRRKDALPDPSNGQLIRVLPTLNPACRWMIIISDTVDVQLISKPHCTFQGCPQGQHDLLWRICASLSRCLYFTEDTLCFAQQCRHSGRSMASGCTPRNAAGEGIICTCLEDPMHWTSADVICVADVLNASGLEVAVRCRVHPLIHVKNPSNMKQKKSPLQQKTFHTARSAWHLAASCTLHPPPIQPHTYPGSRAQTDSLPGCMHHPLLNQP